MSAEQRPLSAQAPLGARGSGVGVSGGIWGARGVGVSYDACASGAAGSLLLLSAPLCSAGDILGA